MIYGSLVFTLTRSIFTFCSLVKNRKQDLESHERSGNEDSGEMSEEEEEEEEVGVDCSNT